MNNFSLTHISKVINAQVLNSLNKVSISELSFDSRTISNGASTLFFALETTRNNGHKYIELAYKKGVRAFVVHQNINFRKYTEASFLVVQNTFKAFHILGKHCRSEISGQVIGITGSNGKTIVKEWLYELLSSPKNISRSPKSFNSQVGVPMSAWLMDKTADFAIFEAGISEPNEMEKLEKIIEPQIGIITNIGDAHQKNFISIEQKINEKLQLFKNSEIIVFPYDDERIRKHLNKCYIQKRKISWSNSNPNASIFFTDVIKQSQFTSLSAIWDGKTHTFKIPFTDDASIENTQTCFATLCALSVDIENFLPKFSSLLPVAMRLEIQEGINDCLLINDSYNSDIQSLHIALDTLNLQASKNVLSKSIIISDIEQSHHPKAILYEKIAQIVKGKDLQRIICIGKDLRKFGNLFEQSTHFFETTDDLMKAIPLLNLKNEAILLKGARHFRFDRIASALKKKVHQTVLEIDLSAMVENLNTYRNRLKPSTKTMAMVKAFSYGSGSAEVARVLQFHNIDYLAVAIADEGIELRNSGITVPIIIMNPERHSFDLMIENRLEPNIYSLNILTDFKACAERHAVVNFPIHIKIDTGMKRLGFDDDDNLSSTVHMLQHSNILKCRSVFTHLSGSDETIFDGFTETQLKKFEKISANISNHLDYPILRHALNSAGIERFTESQYDMVRLGLGLYGISPSKSISLQNVGTLKSTISQIRHVETGESIGYSRKGVANCPSEIAILPIGYADGLSRKLGNGNCYAIINKQKAPYIGNICMDMCMIDVTNIDCKIGDEVILFGEQLPVEILAQAIDTIPYEILTSISQRVTRVYVQE